MLRQWRNRDQRLPILGPRPVGGKLLLVLGGPFHNQAQLSRRQRAAKHRQGLDAEGGLGIPICSMEVRWAMLAPAHADDDPIEDADPRHAREDSREAEPMVCLRAVRDPGHPLIRGPLRYRSFRSRRAAAPPHRCDRRRRPVRHPSGHRSGWPAGAPGWCCSKKGGVPIEPPARSCVSSRVLPINADAHPEPTGSAPCNPLHPPPRRPRHTTRAPRRACCRR